MVDNLGRWTEEKWCDMDYMAAWIRTKGYKHKTSMENLITMIFGYYEDAEEVKEKGYFGVEDTRKYSDNLMVNIPDVEEYVKASGGLSEFDFEP